MPGGSQDFGVSNVANGLGLHHMYWDSMLTVLGCPGDGLRLGDPRDSSWFPSPKDAFRGTQPLDQMVAKHFPCFFGAPHSPANPAMLPFHRHP